MSSRVCVMQSNYLPWKGFFDLIRHSDCFVFLDNVQYTKKSWRNRNRIKSPRGPVWLTVPVTFSLSDRTPIEEVRVAGHGWASSHLRTIEACYAGAPFRDDTMAWLRPMLETAGNMERLSEINHFTIREIAARLGLSSRFVSASDLLPAEILGSFAHNADLMVQLTRAAGGDVCLNGPVAKAYTDEDHCRAHGIGVIWADYSGYAEYPQLHGDFRHDVSVIDLFMMLGPDAISAMKATGFDGSEPVQ